MGAQPAARRRAAQARSGAGACAEDPRRSPSRQARAAGGARSPKQAAGCARGPLPFRSARSADDARARQAADASAPRTHCPAQCQAGPRCTAPPAVDDQTFQAEGAGTPETVHWPNRSAAQNTQSRSTGRAREPLSRRPAPTLGDACAERANARGPVAPRSGASQGAAASTPCSSGTGSPAKGQAAGAHRAATTGTSRATDQRTEQTRARRSARARPTHGARGR